MCLAAGCGREDDTAEDVVAQVNLARLTNSDLENAVAPNAAPDARRALKRKLMEKWIEDEMFYQAAVEEDIHLTDYDQMLVENYRKSILVEKYLQRHLNLNFRILDREIDDYYQTHQREFVWDDDYVHLIHLVLENDDQAIQREIRNSKDLNEVVQKNFFDQQSTAERPIGDMGYVRLQDLPEKLAGRIKNMSTGQIRGPIPTDYGYHYIQLIDYQKKNEVKPLDLVFDEIKMRLRMEKRSEEIQKLKQQLRTRFTIQTDLSKLTQP